MPCRQKPDGTVAGEWRAEAEELGPGEELPLPLPTPSFMASAHEK